MTDWLGMLADLDRVAPDEAVYRRALEGPRRPEPSSGPSRRTRFVAGVTAFAVFALAAAFAWTILRTTHDARPGRVGATPSAGAPLGGEGTVLWPERTTEEIAAAQADADGGGLGWRLDPHAFTTRFAQQVLGWKEGSFDVTLEDAPASGEGTKIAHLARFPVPCPSPLPGQPLSPQCASSAEDVTLVQPATAGEGGIWAVSSVVASNASIDAVPGQTIQNGDAVTGRLDLPEGLSSSAGVLIGSFTSPRNCATLTEIRPEDGEFRVDLSIEADATAGTDCGADTSAYTWVATATWGSPNGKTGDPLDGDSSPYVAVTAVPFILSIPENTPVEGMSTYTDPLGWSVDYPAAWIVTPFTDHTKASGPVSGAAISNLPMSLDAGGYPGVATDGSFEGGVAVVVAHVDGSVFALPRDDSTFPLDPSAAQAIPGPETLSSVVSFRGEGVAYTATFGGQQASAADEQALEAVVRSIRFPALAWGQRNGDWVSMGPADDYPEGKGTADTANPLGVIYIMRGPGGTYALDLEPDGCGEGENETWDPKTLEVVLECPDGTVARFARDGTPDPGNPPGFTAPLEIHPVITAWDGSLLIDVDTRVGGIVDTYWP
jgi:hypothetical protein